MHVRPKRRIALGVLSALIATTLATSIGTAGAAAEGGPPGQSGAPAVQPAGVPKPDSLGKDFWLLFLANLGTAEKTLFITGPTSTTGTVAIPGLSFSQGFSVTPGEVTSVAIPDAAQLSGGVEQLGIHVTAAEEVTVYGLSRIPQTTDAYLGLPTDILGTEHLSLGYDTRASEELGLVATQAGTTVTITPPGGAALPVVELGQGQTYQVQGLPSGTAVTSNKPIAVFGGNQCANIPEGFGYCDHLIEQLPPVETWGTQFLSVPLATRTAGDTFRFLAREDGTAVTVNGASVATLDRGQFHEMVLTTAARITASKPILVAQYSNGTEFDGVTSDPFEMLVPPFEQFLGSYTVTTPASGFATNYVNVVVPSAAIGSLTLDGAAVPASQLTPIGSSGFSGGQLPVELGTHSLSASQPFGVFVYGFDSFDSYGYPGGLSLAPVARVDSVTLTPATSNHQIGTTGCVTATVLDQSDAPLEGIRVDFVRTGPNAGNGFGNTDATGQVDHCYAGSSGGTDTITGTVGSLSDAATITWGDVVIPECVEDGLNSLPVGGLLSQLLHGFEPGLEPITRILLTNLIHTLNCDLVVPVEDLVDAIIYTLTGGPPEPPVVDNPDAGVDVDGDGRTDLSVFRPSSQTWYVQGQPAVRFGQASDVPVPADYTGDGRTDRAVFRQSDSTWYFQGTDPGVQFGQSGDIPVPADYDGDGDDDVAVFRPSGGRWFALGVSGSVAFGANGDVPVPADYDGDGRTDLAVFRPSNGKWYALLGGTTVTVAWGTNGDVPVPGDYDDDGDADVAVYRKSTGKWYVNGGATTAWGAAGDIPVPGDYDGDGDTDLAVFRPTNGKWYVNGGATTAYGTNGDVPLPLPWAVRRTL